MKIVKSYEVNGHLFTNEKLAIIAENLFRAFPEIKFSIENDEIYLDVPTYEGDF